MPRLVSATVLLSERAAAERVYEPFRRHAYEISEVAISPEAVHLETLPNLLRELNANHERGEQVVVASNVATYLLAWYRIWNSLATAFVMIVDPESPAFAAPATEPLVSALAAFHGVKHDSLSGPIYIDFTSDNAALFSEFFGSRRHLERIAPLSDFRFETQLKRHQSFSRCYRLGDQVVAVSSSPPTLRPSSPSALTISLDHQPRTGPVCLGDVARVAPTLVPFAIAAILTDANRSDDEKIMAIQNALRSLVNHPELRSRTVQTLTPLLRVSQLSLRVRAMLAYHLGRETRHSDVLQTFGDAVKTDYLGTRLEFCGFFTFYILQQWFKLPPYSRLYSDQRAVLQQLVHSYRREVLPHVRADAERKRNRLLIAIGECPDAGRYGPISAGVGKARAFKHAFPAWSVAVAITDRHRMDDDENVIPEHRPVSQQFAEVLDEMGDGEEIDWIFADPTLPRRERAAALVDTIRRWSPQVICSFSADRDPVRGLLYPDYPLVERAVGYPIVKADDADVYLSYLDDEQLAKEFDAWGVPQDQRRKYTHYRGMFTLPRAARAHSRSEYGLPESGFVLAIVGYELRNILREETMNLLVEVMTRNEELQIVFVGSQDVPQIEARLLPPLRRRAHLIGPVEDLAGFYQLCDGVAAPAQPGGGVAHAIAMQEGLPVLVEGGHDGDIVLFVGGDNASTGPTAFAEDLHRLVSDPDFALEVAQRSIQAIKTELTTQRDVLERFLAQLSVAEERFVARGGTPIV